MKQARCVHGGDSLNALAPEMRSPRSWTRPSAGTLSSRPSGRPAAPACIISGGADGRDLHRAAPSRDSKLGSATYTPTICDLRARRSKLKRLVCSPDRAVYWCWG